MLCPTDSYNRKPFDGSASPASTQLGDGWARGNYGANAALGQMNDTFCAAYGSAMSCAAGSSSAGWLSPWTRGVMGANASTTIAEIRDGASNTILLGEIRSGIYSCDPRGVWALSGPPSALWGHGSALLDGGGPNAADNGTDDCATCDTILATAGCTDWTNCPELIKQKMTCYPGFVWNNQQRVNSLHINGAQVCFADGSVHWISDFIDSKGNFNSNPPAPSVWDKLNLSRDGQPISSDSY
jgi:prepilin-type processing-associated H-X9-DG protein